MLKYEFIILGFMPDPDINLYASQKEALESLNYNNIPEELNNILNTIGIKFKGFSFFNPYAYNYAVDTLDFKINKTINKKLYAQALIKYETEINQALSKNKSYSGYTATTTDNTETELTDINKKGFSPDVLILNTLIDLLNPLFRSRIKDIIKDSIIFEVE